MIEFRIEDVINTLRKRRQVFSSEADFQLEFAWTIKKLYKDASVRLEYCPCSNDGEKISEMHVDIVVFFGEDCIPIELKYKTKGATVIDDQGEAFVLANHSAKSENCYLFIKDIKRIETLKEKMKGFSKGYAIMLTNNEAYKKEPKENSAYRDFAIDEGKKKTGKLEWKTSDGMNQTKESIDLIGEYTIHWEEYSDVSYSDGSRGQFWYLKEEISHD